MLYDISSLSISLSRPLCAIFLEWNFLLIRRLASLSYRFTSVFALILYCCTFLRFFRFSATFLWISILKYPSPHSLKLWAFYYGINRATFFNAIYLSTKQNFFLCFLYVSNDASIIRSVKLYIQKILRQNVSSLVNVRILSLSCCFVTINTFWSHFRHLFTRRLELRNIDFYDLKIKIGTDFLDINVR